MMDMLGGSSPWSRGALAVGLDVAIKAAALILAAAAVHLALGRRRVLARSMTWNACLAGLLLLPLAASAFPRLRVACLPGGEDVVASTLAPGPMDLADPPTRPAPPDVPAAIAPRVPAARFDLASIIAPAYAAVAAALVLRLLLSIAAVGVLRRSGSAVEGRAWLDALDRWRGRLGIARPVGLMRSGRVGVPVVVGWLRPTILLPEGLVDAAAPAAVDAVILHELAHVRRGDYAWNLLLRLVRAIYWPHPLTWPLGRVVGGLRERACDDLCVYWMGDAMAYRTTLLDLASGLVRRPGPALGLAMARSTKLGRRLAEIDRSPGASRCQPRRPARAAILAASILTVALLGSLRLARIAAAPPPKEPVEPAAPDAPKPPAEAPAPKPAAPEPKAEPAPPEVPATPPAMVEVETLRKGPFRRAVNVVGTAQPSQTADLYARVAGNLSGLTVEIGDRVKKGDRLAMVGGFEGGAELKADRMAARQAQARHHQAQAAVLAARAALGGDGARVDEARAAVKKAEAEADIRQQEFTHTENLAKQKVVSSQEVELTRQKLESARAAVLAAQAQVRAAEATSARDEAELEGALAGRDLAALGVEAAADAAEAGTRRVQERDDAARVVAPFDGLITRRGAQDGDFVRPADDRGAAPVVTVARTDPMRVVVALSENLTALLDRGDPAAVNFAAIAGRTFRGKVSRLAAEIDPRSGTLRAEVDLPNADGLIRAGQSGTVTIVLDEQPGAISIPRIALSLDDEGPSCYRVVDGRAASTRLKLGNHGDERVEVLEGLAEGDVVITDPFKNRDGRALDGRPVTIRPKAEPPGSR